MTRIDRVIVRVSHEMTSERLADQIATEVRQAFAVKDVHVEFVSLDGDTMAELTTKGDPFTRREHDQVFAVVRDVLMDWKHGVITTDGHVKP